MEGFMWLADFFSTVNANSSASDELCLAPQSMQTREWGGGHATLSHSNPRSCRNCLEVMC